ncbi:hypothetical protein, partial [Companilactobacillus furfuricola]|uniref:hypothetical protein n=1 Tax=Companilactobacillus furfuricola TaxID=1462575 RepID=UPI001B882EAB
LMKIGIEYISLFLNKCIKITKPRREPVYRLVKDPALKQSSGLLDWFKVASMAFHGRNSWNPHYRQ